MNLKLNRRKKYLIAGGLLLATATPGFALFGVGDIVFDPTSYASLVSRQRPPSTSSRQSRTTLPTFRSSSSGRRLLMLSRTLTWQICLARPLGSASR